MSSLSQPWLYAKLTFYFCSHATHHLYAIYTLGAPGDVLHAALESHAVYQRPAFASPGEITDANWTEHFEDEQYVMTVLSSITLKRLIIKIDTIRRTLISSPERY